MFQHRLVSTLFSLTALASFGLPQISYAASSTESVGQISGPEHLQIAQALPGETTRTLYVTGTSQVSTPADQAVLVLSFYPNSYSSYADPDAVPTPPQVLASDISTATDAATAAGATDVKVSPDLSSPGSMRVRMVLNQPTRDKVEQLLTAITTAVVKTNRYTNAGANVGYTIRDCSALEANARQAAMVDATQRANALAGVSSQQLGQMISVSESVSWGASFAATCPTSSSASFTDLYSTPYYDPASPAEVRLTYSLSVTYGLE